MSRWPPMRRLSSTPGRTATRFACGTTTLFVWRSPGSAHSLGKGDANVPQLYIDPTECIDCGACVPVCPVTAIFALDDLPEKWHAYIETNKNYVDGGKFQSDKYQRSSS